MLRAEITELLPGCCTFVPVGEIKRILTPGGSPVFFVPVLPLTYSANAGRSGPQGGNLTRVNLTFENSFNGRTGAILARRAGSPADVSPPVPLRPPG